MLFFFFFHFLGSCNCGDGAKTSNPSFARGAAVGCDKFKKSRVLNYSALTNYINGHKFPKIMQNLKKDPIYRFGVVSTLPHDALFTGGSTNDSFDPRSKPTRRRKTHCHHLLLFLSQPISRQSLAFAAHQGGLARTLMPPNRIPAACKPMGRVGTRH